MERQEEDGMKFIHTADIHLGAKPDAGPLYSRQRPGEIWKTFERVVQVCEDEKADLLLIAGDLFHRQPLRRELKEADYLFSQLSRTKVVLIAGNHDYISANSNYRTFHWSENVFPLFGDKMQCVRFPELGTAVYGLSYYRREIPVPLYDGVRAEGVERYEILLGHGGDEKHIPFDRDNLKQAGFDYIALGHIHKPAVLVKDHMIYAGALEPTDKNDTGEHGYIKGEITEQGVSTRWIPAASRKYIHLEIQVSCEDTAGSVRKQIEKKTDEYGIQNIYKIMLRGKRNPETVFDPEWLTGESNVAAIDDGTVPAYDFERMYRENQDTVLGRYIELFRGCREGSVEYRALCEGVDALLGGRQRGGSEW